MPSPEAVPLSQETLSRLPSEVTVPRYDRSALVPGVVHIGVGGFHRAHQAVYLDDLAGAGVLDWGLTGVGLRSPEMGEVLAAQDCLYLVVERSPERDRARVIGSVTAYLFGPGDPDAVLDALSDERTRLVTLTITGTSYRIDAHSGQFDGDDPDVRRDLEDPGHPTTVFGYLVEALSRRRRQGRPPFTVLSCDNMPHNGAAARTAVISFARLRDERAGDDLAGWIEEHVTFPSSMVDRITPATSPEEREALVERFGVADRWPVVTEPFSQWIMEDAFCNGRPPLERVGVQLVDDVSPYETMKTRMLNAGHTALGYLGYLAGYRTTDELMAEPAYRTFLERMLSEEVVPLLPPVPGIDLQEYQRSLVERLSNPRMGDQLARLCRRGSTKVATYLLPSVEAAMAAGKPYQLLVLAVAGWMRYLRGYDYVGDEVPVVGPRMHLVGVAEDAGTDPRPLLDEHEVFGSVGQEPAFVDAVRRALVDLEEQGPREVIEMYLASSRQLTSR